MDDRWKRADFSKPENVRHACVSIAEYAESALHTSIANKQSIKALREELATRDTVVLQTLARIEDTGRVTHALAAASAVRLERIDREKEVRVDELIRIRRTVQTTTTQLADLDKREAVGRERLSSQIEILEKRDVELQDTGQRTLTELLGTQREVMRSALTSGHDLVKDAQAAQRETAKDTRTNKHQVLMYILGVLGAVILMIASAVIGAKISHAGGAGVPPIPPLPSSR